MHADALGAVDGPWSSSPLYRQWAGAIDAAESAQGLPVGMLTRLLWRESHFRPELVSGAVRSRAGAVGIAQFLPDSAAYLGVNPLDPASSIDGAARYLRKLYDSFGSWALAAAAYNHGGGNIRKWQAGRKTLPRETLQYVAEVAGVELPAVTA